MLRKKKVAETKNKKWLESLNKVQRNEGKAKETDVSDFHEKSIYGLFYVNAGTLNGARKCNFCKAFLFKRENSSFCCSNGKININSEQQLKQCPTVLLKLFENKELIRNIRPYNNVMTMASLGVDHKPEFGPNFKIQGKLSHKIGSLLPEPDQNPKFAQIYFHDAD